MLRGLCILFGLAILGATAHVTIEHTGGYQSPHAVLTIAIAAGVGIGSLILGAAWRAGRYALVVAIAIALLCGELFGLVRTAERLVDARAEAQAPYRAATKTRADAVKRVEQLSANLKSLPTTSTRLETAVRNKQAADRAVVEQASLRGCVPLLHLQSLATRQQTCQQSVFCLLRFFRSLVLQEPVYAIGCPHSLALPECFVHQAPSSSTFASSAEPY